jgi:hypothetical protein
MKTKVFEIIEIGVEKGVDIGFGKKYSLLPNMVLCLGGGGNSSIIQCCYSKFYMGHLPMKTKFITNIECVMPLKWSRVR